MGYRVHQKDFNWFVTIHCDTPAHVKSPDKHYLTFPFEDGMTIDTRAGKVL